MHGELPGAASAFLSVASRSHVNFAPALVRDAVRNRSEALERRLRTSPKRPTRAKE